MEPACACTDPGARASEPPRRAYLLQRRWYLFVSCLVLLSLSASSPPATKKSLLYSKNLLFPLPGMQLAHGQVVGVDLGSEFVKVALVAAGRPMEIILNSASKRKTSHAVSFADAEKRDMGDEGAAAASKRPDHVFMHSNLFLGLSAADVDTTFTGAGSDVASSCQKEEGASQCTDEQQPRYLPLKLQAEQSLLREVGYPHGYYPYRLYADKKRHTVAFLAREGMYLSAEMVTANFLSYLRKMVAQAANVPPSTAIGVVITVPCRFSQRQRQALRDAAEIAGMRPIALVHHAAAAATQHALDMPLPAATATGSSGKGAASDKPEAGKEEATTAGESSDDSAGATPGGRSTKLFVDVGSAAVDFSLVRFEPVPLTQPNNSKKGKDSASNTTTTAGGGGPSTYSVQMLSCETLYGIGGHNLDIGLAELMREAFQKRYPDQGDLWKTPRALKKLLRQAVLSKHILSANKKTQFSVEGLLTTESGAELDLHELIDRSHVESVLERIGLRSRMQEALQKTLRQAQLEMKDIDQVELLGGGWRVPHVQQELTAVLGGLSPGMHLNGDEAMATGAAFVAANNTATFRVKKYFLADATPYEYSLKIVYTQSTATTGGGSGDDATSAAAAASEDTEQQQQQQSDAEESTRESIKQDGKEGEVKKEKGEVTEKIVTLYARNTKFGGAPTSKTVSVRTAEDFTVELLEDGTILETVAIRGVPEAVAKQHAAALAVEEAEKQRQQQEGAAEAAGTSRIVEKKVLGDPKVSLVFSVDGSGVLAFDRAYASFTVQHTEEVVPPASSSSTPPAETAGASAGSETTPSSAEAAAETGGESTSSKAPEKEGGAAATNEEEKNKDKEATQTPAPVEAAVPTRVQKKKQVVEPLSAERTLAMPLPLTTDEKQQLQQQLSDLEAADLQVHLFSEAINRLESFIYATRNALDEAAVTEVMQPEDIEELQQKLQQNEDYLYSNAKDEGLEAVKKRQEELEAVVMPIRERAAERAARPEVTKALDEALAEAVGRLQRVAKLLEQQKDRPPQEKVQKAEEVKDSLQSWWEEKREEQAKRKDWEDPAFTSAEARKKLRELDAALTAAEEAAKPPATTTGGGGKKSGAAAAARRKRAAREAAAAAAEKQRKPAPQAETAEDAEQNGGKQEGTHESEEAPAEAAADKQKDYEAGADEAAPSSTGEGDAGTSEAPQTSEQQQEQQQQEEEQQQKEQQVQGQQQQGETSDSTQTQEQQAQTVEHKDEL